MLSPLVFCIGLQILLLYGKGPVEWINPCSSISVSSLPFCNISLSFEERAYDLVYNEINKLSDSLSAYVGLTGTTPSLPIKELNISSYVWQNEALHGVAISPGVDYEIGPIRATTMYPQVITTASSFNSSLFYLIGHYISNEARAMYNYHQAGITYWAPNINIYRDPRWGRGQETPGEDPFLSAVYAANYVLGMQGNDSKYLKVSSSCKHFMDYSMEDSDGVNRHNFNAIVSDYDQNDTYLVAFKYCIIEGNVSSIMCSYNSENGIPSCANKQFLTDTLRNEWNFNGYIVSDCDAVIDVEESHNYTKTNGETINAVFSAGMDIDCGLGFNGSSYIPSFTQQNTVNAIQSNQAKLSDVQRAVYHSILVMMRLGMFDDPKLNPYSKLNSSDVCSNNSLQIALDAARQSVVLIKNENNTLPITTSDNIKTVALIGPNAKSTSVMKGDYAGIAPFIISVYDGLRKYIPNKNNIIYAEGCDISSNSSSGIAAAVNAAKSADLTILVVGLNENIESEGNDRTNILLPGQQYNLIKQVSISAKGDVILIVLSGGCVDIKDEYYSSYIKSIIIGGYGGMFGGEGIMDVIFGAFNPTGRLTQTWYLNEYMNEIEMINMNMRENKTNGDIGRGYRYYSGKNILFNFGDGLSFTSFNCTKIIENDNKLITTITNNGDISGGAVILIFFIPNNPGKNGNPLKRLIAFQRVNLLNPKQSQTVQMTIYPEFYNSNQHKNIDGQYLLAGSCNN